MSYVDKNNNDNDEVFVVTIKELFFIGAVFVIILFVLYPKDIIKQQIVSEQSSYDLSMLYLKNLLKYSPKDESLKLILAEQSLRSGDIKHSLELLDQLIFSPNPKINSKALLLSYELRKSEYFKTDNTVRKDEIKRVLKQLFYSIYEKKLYDEKKFDYWYKEAVFNQHHEASYHFVKKELEVHPNDIAFLEMAYFLANKFKDEKNAQKYIVLLIKYDTKHQDKWATAYYYYLVNNKHYKKARKIVERFGSLSIVWTNRLAEFYAMRKYYKKAATVYKKLFKQEKEYEKKKEYFFKAVANLQAGGYYQQSANLARKYQHYYYKDLEARQFLLKLYLQTDHLDYAVDLSKKILKSMFK